MASTEWNKKYNANEYVYGIEPIPYFIEVLERYRPDNLLLPGEGEGRNAVYAAKKGVKVFAFDQSRTAYQKAQKLAKEHGVQIDYKVCDILESNYPRQYFQMIGIFYLHLPVEVRQKAHQHLLNFLAPGGVLVLEAFHKRNIGNDFGPKTVEMLYDEITLKADFQSLVIEEYFENHYVFSHGCDDHRGQAELIRFCAIKPH